MNYYTEYIESHKNEYPELNSMIKEASYTEEDKIVNYITEQMSGRDWTDIQDVLIGVGMQLDDMSHRGEQIKSASVINSPKKQTFFKPKLN